MGACRNCGEFVTSDFARVFGGNDDVVHACLACATLKEIQTGEAVGIRLG